MPLFDAQRHERLIDTPWDEARVRAAIGQIAADAHRAFSTYGLWPIHPSDISPERPPDSLKTLYYGAAGVIWALKYLDETGAIALGRDYLPTVRELSRRHRDDVAGNAEMRAYMGRELASYFMGDAGFALLHWKLAPSDDVAQHLHDAIEQTLGDPRGLVWGAAGTMLAALFMHQRTGESRWKEKYLRNFEALWESWEYADDLRCRLWTFELYGITEKRLGALHGMVANAYAMLRGIRLVAPARRDETLDRIYEALSATALEEDGRVNWPHNVGASTRPTPMSMYLQHCIGAPGVINCMADLPNESRWPIESLLLRAGELVWDAGPPSKMPVLCHGAAGSGYAFLKLYARTRDERWLKRARRFAMHSIEQSERAAAKHGQRKFSLWTGDLGLAIFLWDCVRGAAAIPTLDVF